MAKKPEKNNKAAPAKKPEAAKVNKSEAVRNYLKEHPGTQNKDVAAALSAQGIKMLPDYVATVKGNMKAKKGKRKRRQKAAEVAAVETGLSVANIKAAFGLIKQCGGVSQAREALASAAEIQRVM
jgi:hypothetical protein